LLELIAAEAGVGLTPELAVTCLVERIIQALGMRDLLEQFKEVRHVRQTCGTLACLVVFTQIALSLLDRIDAIPHVTQTRGLVSRWVLTDGRSIAVCDAVQVGDTGLDKLTGLVAGGSGSILEDLVTTPKQKRRIEAGGEQGASISHALDFGLANHVVDHITGRQHGILEAAASLIAETGHAGHQVFLALAELVENLRGLAAIEAAAAELADQASAEATEGGVQAADPVIDTALEAGERANVTFVS
jgi:hypothetical protein